MYDIRIEHYPAFRVSALQNKIREMSNYIPDAKEARLAEVEKLLNLTGDNTIPEMLVLYMGLVGTLYTEGQRTAEDMMDNYTNLMAILEKQEKSQPNDEKVQEAKQTIEDMLIGSGVATCDNLLALFTPRFEANPDDLDLVSKVVSLLSGSDCMTSDLFLKSVTALNKLSPSYKTAFYLYRLHAAKGENNDAARYLREAINSPDISDGEKGEYLYHEALLYFRSLNNTSRAMASAVAAIDASPFVRGKSYMLIASIWGGQRCGETDIEQRAPFWVAVDFLNRAKAADPSCAAEADKMIAQYRQYFPLQEETFMYDLAEGSEYTVVCGGMSAKTTVRTRR
jgi:tetratricopeptide (TPR) repeat protein